MTHRRRGSFRPRIWVLVTVGLAASLTGCRADPAPAPAPSSPPVVVTTSPSPSSPPGRWRGLSGTCPTLNSPAARELNANGEGQTTSGPVGSLDVNVRCGWGGGQQRPFVDVTVLVFNEQSGQDGSVEQRARKSFGELVAQARKDASDVVENGTAGTVEAEPGVGDEASMVTLATASVAYLVVRTGNAVVTVRIYDTILISGGIAGRLAALRQRHPAVRQITTDVLDDLR